MIIGLVKLFSKRNYRGNMSILITSHRRHASDDAADSYSNQGASMGAGLGGTGEVNMTRRGTDKTIFQICIITGIVFIASLVMGILK